MKKTNPFDELLERLESRAEGDEGCDKSDFHDALSNAEMIKHLKVGYSLLTRVPDLKPGDIIRGVRELTESHIRNWDHPHILVEILETPATVTLDNDGLASNITSKRHDCIVACCVPNKGNGWIVRHYADMREWEPYPLTGKETKTNA